MQDSTNKRGLLLLVFLTCLTCVAGAVEVQVLAEEEVYAFVSPDNGSGPMWAYGSTEIARADDRVFVCQMETGEGVPPLSNTRWRLLERRDAGWVAVAETDRFVQREPCPLAVIGDTLFLSVNDSTQPPGTKYGNCEPHVLRFTFTDGEVARAKLSPAWAKQHTFTDHSYRGFAADPPADKVVLLNIDANTSEQNACLMTADGETVGTASVSFPIRACYPQVALRGNAVHVLAIGDIVEPIPEWRTYKFDQTQSAWDYVFRILYYTRTHDIAKSAFAAPLDIANVDATGGHISNQDLWISPDGDAYILYTEREVASALLRDKFFPGKSIIASLRLAIVSGGPAPEGPATDDMDNCDKTDKPDRSDRSDRSDKSDKSDEAAAAAADAGAVIARRVLYPGDENTQPGCARLHVAADGTLYAVLYVTGPDPGNKLLQVHPPVENPPLIPIPAQAPLPSFCLAGVRAGNAPSNTIDLLGQVGNTLRYLQARIAPNSPAAAQASRP